MKSIDKFKAFCEEVYLDMPKPIQQYFIGVGKLWKGIKPFMANIFFYFLTIMVFYYIYNSRGFEITLIIVLVSMMFRMGRK